MDYNFTNLKVGTLVELELLDLQNKPIKLKTIVEEVLNESRIRIFAPVSKGKTFPIRLNQSLDLVTVRKDDSIHKYDILSCRCKVVDKLKDGTLSTIELVRTGEFSQIQRRNYFRLPLIKTIELFHDNKKYEMLTKDLSGNGIKGYVSTKLPAESEGVLFLDVGDSVLELKYKVIECNPDPEHSYRYEMRASFINIKGSQLSALLKFIFTKQSESIRKQMDLKDYVSILDSDQSYSDFFSMTNMEKLVRISPFFLWCITFVEYAFFVNAFRETNMGLNLFFGQFTRDFRPELLTQASHLGFVTILLTFISFIFNLNYNVHSKKKIMIHYLLVLILALVAIGFNVYFNS